MPAPARGRAVRTLADDLRARDDAALVALLGARPDLATPVPADTASLAARASTRVSVHRALDTLDSPTLQVAQALAALGSPTASRDLARACGGRIGPQVSTLRRLALVWGPDAGLRLVRAAADVLGPHPAGLGPPLAEIGTDPARLADWLADQRGDPEALETLLSTGPDAARRLLERLTWGSPVGAVAGSDRRVRAAAADGGVEWLLARALLVAADAGHVVVPREVGLALRGGRVDDHLTPRPDPEPVSI